MNRQTGGCKTSCTTFSSTIDSFESGEWFWKQLSGKLLIELLDIPKLLSIMDFRLLFEHVDVALPVKKCAAYYRNMQKSVFPRNRLRCNGTMQMCIFALFEARFTASDVLKPADFMLRGIWEHLSIPCYPVFALPTVYLQYFVILTHRALDTSKLSACDSPFT